MLTHFHPLFIPELQISPALQIIHSFVDDNRQIADTNERAKTRLLGSSLFGFVKSDRPKFDHFLSEDISW